MLAVRVSGLVRRYGLRPALDGVDVTLETGQTLAVLGPNGSGKSTLLRVLATLLRPHAGEVEVLGEALPARGWATRGRVGYLGHEPLLYRDLTGRENLRHQARLFGVSDGRVEELLEQARAGYRADEPVRTLSRGWVQRLAACRAVLHEPELLLLDEPWANLDPAAAAALDPLLGGVTRIVTSHDPARALDAADVVLGLRAGRVALSGPAAGADPRDLYT